MHIPTEHYLGINTKQLSKRSLRDVVGLNFMNAAATAWHNKQHEKALTLYKQAEQYMPGDPLLATFMAFNYLLTGNITEGKRLCHYVKTHPHPDILYPDTLIDDYLNGNTNIEGIALVYEHVDDTRASILKKTRGPLGPLKTISQVSRGALPPCYHLFAAGSK